MIQKGLWSFESENLFGYMNIFNNFKNTLLTLQMVVIYTMQLDIKCRLIYTQNTIKKICNWAFLPTNYSLYLCIFYLVYYFYVIVIVTEKAKTGTLAVLYFVTLFVVYRKIVYNSASIK